MNATWMARRTRRISRKLVFGLLTDTQDRGNIVLQHVEPLGWSQRQHPADQRQVDTVLAVRWDFVRFHFYSKHSLFHRVDDRRESATRGSRADEGVRPTPLGIDCFFIARLHS